MPACCAMRRARGLAKMRVPSACGGLAAAAGAAGAGAGSGAGAGAGVGAAAGAAGATVFAQGARPSDDRAEIVRIDAQLRTRPVALVTESRPTRWRVLSKEGTPQ